MNCCSPPSRPNPYAPAAEPSSRHCVRRSEPADCDQAPGCRPAAATSPASSGGPRHRHRRIRPADRRGLPGRPARLRHHGRRHRARRRTDDIRPDPAGPLALRPASAWRWGRSPAPSGSRRPRQAWPSCPTTRCRTRLRGTARTPVRAGRLPGRCPRRRGRRRRHRGHPRRRRRHGPGGPRAAGRRPHQHRPRRPGHLGQADLFAAHGLRPVPVAVDDRGIRVDDLAATGCRVVQVTSAHQFPLASRCTPSAGGHWSRGHVSVAA